MQRAAQARPVTPTRQSAGATIVAKFANMRQQIIAAPTLALASSD